MGERKEQEESSKSVFFSRGGRENREPSEIAVVAQRERTVNHFSRRAKSEWSCGRFPTRLISYMYLPVSLRLSALKESQRWIRILF